MYAGSLQLEQCLTVSTGPKSEHIGVRCEPKFVANVYQVASVLYAVVKREKGQCLRS